MPEPTREPTPFELAKAWYAEKFNDRHWKRMLDVLKLKNATKRTQIRLSKLLKSYEDEQHLVKHIILEPDSKLLPRDSDFEEEIRDRFGLRGAIVVDTACLSRQQADARTLTNRIHQQLGFWGGRLLTALIRPNDTVGTGGGRGLNYTAQNCSMSAGYTHFGNVVSLTGRIGSDVDADHVAALLSARLETRGNLYLLNCPITDRRRKLNLKDVDIAITGIGSLTETHRFTHFNKLKDLAPVADLLKKIIEKSQTVAAALHGIQNGPCYHPVGDLCNWCFFVEPPSGHPKPKEAAEIERMVHKLNERLLNTTPDDLSRIAKKGAVIAVAGGIEKAGAIGYALKRGKGQPWISHLVTDTEVAKYILNERNFGGL